MTTNIEHQRHSLAHLLGAAVTELYPDAKLTLGPAVDDGFYYDIKFADGSVSENELESIEHKMRELLPTWTTVTHKELSKEEALEYFKGNEFKEELINEIAERGEKITIYTMGSFTDLCRGGHVDDLASIDTESFKLDRIAGAYWRGKETNPMLTRIYGLAFESKESLDNFIKQKQEAEKRDHRKLGQELQMFTFSEYVGPGLPLWMPNGTVLVEELEKLAKESEFLGGYDRVRTPHIAKEEMYITSGHLPYYEESMYPPMEYEGGKYYLKSMNCPHHHQIFAATPHSYRDLPVRLAEHGTVYRHEKSGELFGIMRVRALCQNDAHIYCSDEQFAEEFKAVNDLYIKYFNIFGIEKYVMRLSTHDPKKLGQKYVNEPELWLKTEKMVRDVLIESKIPYIEVPDEAAFYGPKIDVQVWSAIGREFSLATNQVDFAVPKKFGLSYVSKEGKAETPLCIHRAPLGTHERFIGFLIEHYAGEFPVWLAPLQVAVIPVGEKHEEAAKQLRKTFNEKMIRAEVYSDGNSLGKRIHAAKALKTPYVIVLGDKEIDSGTFTVEARAGKLENILIEDFISRIDVEIKERKDL